MGRHQSRVSCSFRRLRAVTSVPADLGFRGKGHFSGIDRSIGGIKFRRYQPIQAPCGVSRDQVSANAIFK